MAFYSGAPFPHWQGSLFVGSLKFGMLSRLSLDGDAVVAEERLLARSGIASVMCARVPRALHLLDMKRRAVFPRSLRRAERRGARGAREVGIRLAMPPVPCGSPRL